MSPWVGLCMCLHQKVRLVTIDTVRRPTEARLWDESFAMSSLCQAQEIYPGGLDEKKSLRRRRYKCSSSHPWHEQQRQC